MQAGTKKNSCYLLIVSRFGIQTKIKPGSQYAKKKVHVKRKEATIHIKKN